MSAGITRRSLLGTTAAALGATRALTGNADADEVIPGFDQTRTQVDQSDVWEPYSDRRIRFGLVGYGLCKFSAEFEFQNHPNVEIVAVSDLFPDRCSALAERV